VIRQRIVASLRELALSLGPKADGTEWHLFGSVDRDSADAADTDLMILCQTDQQADELREAINPDAFLPPLHLSLMTFREAAEIAAVDIQRSRRIFP
jgi:predicted nucleotidyltransferase